MADITLTTTVAVSKGGATTNSGTVQVTANMTGTNFVSQVHNVSTSAALDVGDVSGTPAFVFVKNLDASVDITLAKATDTFIDLGEGEVSLFTPNDSTINAAADSGTVEVWVIAAEE